MDHIELLLGLNVLATTLVGLLIFKRRTSHVGAATSIVADVHTCDDPRHCQICNPTGVNAVAQRERWGRWWGVLKERDRGPTE